jgi:hypothetical protein
MNGSVIVWDLETVPDVHGFAAANGLAGKSDEEVRAAMGDKFPKHIYHSIVCIGALVARREDDHWVEIEKSRRAMYKDQRDWTLKRPVPRRTGPGGMCQTRYSWAS